MAQAASTAGGGGSLWKSAVSTLGTRAIDIPSRYGFHLLIAGKLGVIDAGAFYIVFSVITLVAGAGRLGIDRALTREVARLQALGDIAGLRRSVRAGLLTITGFSAAAAILLALSSPFLARFLFGNPALQVPLLLSAATLVPLCLSAGAAGALAGLHRVATSQMIYSWLWPALFCLLALPLRLDVERVMLLILCSTTFAALLSFALLWRFMPKSGAAGGETGRPRLIALGWSLFTTEIVQLLVAAMPALVLGMLADQAAVGAYSIAWRLALILNLLVVAVAAMASPRFADQAARGDQEGIRQTASKSVGLVLAAGILPLVVLWIGAPFFLSLFGSGFVSGAASLRIILAGQFVVMLSTATPELLGMTGFERDMQRVNNLAILLYLPALLFLSWTMAAEGAAIASVLVALVTAIGASYLCRKFYGFLPLTSLASSLRRK